MLLAGDCDSGVAISIHSKSSKNAIRRLDTVFFALNDIEVHFQYADHELRADKTENVALVETFSVLQAEVRAERAKRDSLQVFARTVQCPSTK